jgi:hypothetical protein
MRSSFLDFAPVLIGKPASTPDQVRGRLFSGTCDEPAIARRGLEGIQMYITNIMPTLMSLVALMFSGYSLYESALRAPQLSIYVAPRIDYTDPDRPENVREVFILPLTIANDGARGATVLALNLAVVNPRTKQKKMFFAARLGAWGAAPLRPFAPVVLAGRATFSQAVQFEPRNGETVPRILDSEAGKYAFELTVETAAARQVAGLAAGGVTPLQFEMQIGELDYRYFQGTGTMEMWAPDYRAPASVSR